MTHPVLVLVRNNQVITSEAVQSILNQTVEVELFVTNNQSTDGTHSYLNSLYHNHRNVHVIHHYPGWGVAQSWNEGLRSIFAKGDHCLVPNNDTILRSDTYDLLLSQGGPFVTGVGVRGEYFGEEKGGVRLFRDSGGREVFPGVVTLPLATRPHPDFSCYLIRKEVWEKVGPFDEEFRGAYGEDADYHVRMHKAGVEAVCVDVPFYHYGAGTMGGLTEDAREKVSVQANANRAYFKSKWGCEIGSTEYYHGLFGVDAPEDSHFGHEEGK